MTEWDVFVSWGGLVVLAFIVIAFIWLFPTLFVLFSGRTHGGAKFGWFLITVFFSWVGFAVFLIFTQRPKERHFLETNRVAPRF
jgi:Na+/melibiose symporter-like transporter